MAIAFMIGLRDSWSDNQVRLYSQNSNGLTEHGCQGRGAVYSHQSRRGRSVTTNEFQWGRKHHKPLVSLVEPVLGFEPRTDGLQIRFWHFATTAQTCTTPALRLLQSMFSGIWRICRKNARFHMFDVALCCTPDKGGSRKQARRVGGRGKRSVRDILDPVKPGLVALRGI